MVYLATSGLVNNTLIVLFLVIFVATAVITLASLPGWIKIPDGYRKALFSTLILEVIACIVFLFRTNILNEDFKGDPSKTRNWIAIDCEGNLFQPVYGKDTLGMSVNDFSQQIQNKCHTLSVEKDTFFIKNNKSFCLGHIDQKDIANAGLFKGIDTKNGFWQISFSKLGANSPWKMRPLNFEEQCNLKFSIGQDNNYGYYYSIFTLKGKDTTSYVKSSSFNLGERDVHFFKATDGHYLVRISDARISQDTSFVKFIVLRLTPTN